MLFRRESASKASKWDALSTDTAFPFPSNGKAHSDSNKKIARFYDKSTRFPFPSNGKAHSDYMGHFHHNPFEQVSIPFKREGSFGQSE